MATQTGELFCKQVQPDAELCILCAVAQKGLACWEVDTSPCCQRPRTTCERCPVFIGYLRSTATPTRVLISTADAGLLEGIIFLPPGVRVSDLLNNPNRSFLAVSKPRWRTATPMGGAAPPVIIISLSSVSWVAPLDEEASRGCEARVA
ncbi:MAG: hypothetical protein N2512_12780 [Armatimonadetes bacterium]|nr:hypothetical protein [Armatimonadota bacterium]